MNTILQLSKSQKKFYELFYKEMSQGSYIIKLPLSFPKHEALLLVKLILGEHPELINYDNCCVFFENIGFVSVLRLQPIFHKNEILNAQRRFDSELKNILKCIIKPRANTIQKVLAIHDYLVCNVVYDQEEQYRANSRIHTHTAYGAIVEKKAVCEGIAYAFSLLAQKAGIFATVVNGFADGGEHSWNMIQIGSECYHIDVTWDISKRPDPHVKVYDYFCLSDSDLKRRTWDKNLYPQCCSSRYNYFNVMKSYAHNEQQLRSIMLRQYAKHKSLYIRCDFLNLAREDTADYIWHKFLDVARENNLSVSRATVSLNADQGIFHFLF